MMEKELSVIDVSLGNIWKSWFLFRKGKKVTPELDRFQYHLEQNLSWLFSDLKAECYRHGPYRKFIVNDNKTREIAVAGIRDRIIHRLIYDYLVRIYDKIFLYDAWSCREGKGLIACIGRTQQFLRYHPCGFVWKADIRKFFDTVSHRILLELLSKKIKDQKALRLLGEVIRGFERERERVTRASPSVI